jgi:hypothetical protein
MNLQVDTIKELNDIISLRNHIYTLVNGPRTTLISREEENKLRVFANQLDRVVVDKSLQMVNVSKAVPVVKNTHKAMEEANVAKTISATEEAAIVQAVTVVQETITALDAPVKVKPKRGSFKRVADDIE